MFEGHEQLGRSWGNSRLGEEPQRWEKSWCKGPEARIGSACPGKRRKGAWLKQRKERWLEPMCRGSRAQTALREDFNFVGSTVGIHGKILNREPARFTVHF